MAIGEFMDLGKVSETLLIPLAARARESARRRPVLVDPASVRILEAVAVDCNAVDGGAVSTHGILARTLRIDQSLAELLAKYPDSLIINLGAGLDTRRDRMDNGVFTWYDLDVPSVIALRRRFFSEGERFHFIAQSVLAFSWMDVVEEPAGRNIVLIAEGLLMYLQEEEVRLVLEALAARFPGAQLLFDVVHGYFVGKSILSPFTWGLNNAADLAALTGHVRLLQAWSTGDLLTSRQQLVLRLMNCLPATRNRSQILQVELIGR